MKLRIKGNSVRMRLSQDEVARLVLNGEVWSQCQIGDSVLKYGLKAVERASLSCDLNNHTVQVNVPFGFLENWDVDERVGFEHRDESIFILVEKDWQCLKPRDHEDESNLYAHPASSD